MGLFDYFRRRRERESAVPSLEITPPSTQVQPLSGETDASQAVQAAGVDLAQLGQIGQMIAEAARSGNIQIQQGDSVQLDGPQTIDLQGSGLRDEILGILDQHGIDPDPAAPQQIDASQMPEMQQQIMDAIARQGVDLSQFMPGAVSRDFLSGEHGEPTAE